MSKCLTSEFFRAEICRLTAARLRQLPTAGSLVVFGILSVLTHGTVGANPDPGGAESADALVHSRIGEAAYCTRYGINRVVELRATDMQQAPCEVAYLKPDEDQSTTSLWRAQNDYGYCVSKFDEFIIKLVGTLQWDCELGGDLKEQASEAPVPSDPLQEVPVLVVAGEATDRASGGPGTAVSMDDVRSRIPSGPYRAITLAGTDASACPPGGSFFWNTRNPDQPVFEMGQDAEFTFSTARGRVGQGFALQAEPPLIVESDDFSPYQVASLSVIGAGKVEARVSLAEGADDTRTALGESVCQYSLGGG